MSKKFRYDISAICLAGMGAIFAFVIVYKLLLWGLGLVLDMLFLA